MVTLAVGLATSLVAAAAALLVAAVLARPRGISAIELLRLYPCLVRLLARLSKDRRIGRAVRWRLLVALAYNVQPINLIPDFVPVIGLADNIVVTAWAVRSAIRKSGPAVVLSNWCGSRAGFALLCRLCRLNVQYAEALPPGTIGEERAGQREALPFAAGDGWPVAANSGIPAQEEGPDPGQQPSAGWPVVASASRIQDRPS